MHTCVFAVQSQKQERELDCNWLHVYCIQIQCCTTSRHTNEMVLHCSGATQMKTLMNGPEVAPAPPKQRVDP